MIKIICGEDVIASRIYFQQLKNQYRTKNYTIAEIASENIIDLNESILTLFDNKKIYFSNFVYHKVPKNKKLINKLEELSKDPNLMLYIFEEKKKYDLPYFKNFFIIEFKPQNDIFKLLDNFIPNNKINFLEIINKIIDKKNENMFLYLLTKRVRELLIVKSGGKLKTKNAWYKNKITHQSYYWPSEKLIRFYQGLLNIEKNIKTSSSPYSIKESLDIFIAYSL